MLGHIDNDPCVSLEGLVSGSSNVSAQGWKRPPHPLLSWSSLLAGQVMVWGLKPIWRWQRRISKSARTFTYPSRCCSIACYVLFSVLSFLSGWLSQFSLLTQPLSVLYHLSSLLELNHVQVIERHKMPITSEDVHVAFGVDDRNMAITSSGLGTSDQAKFVFVAGSVVIETAKLLSLFHLLVILIKAMVSVLDDEGVHHRH